MSNRNLVRNPDSLEKSLFSDDPFETSSEWANRVAYCRKTKHAIIHVFFVCGVLGVEYARSLVGEYVNRGVIKKEDLVDCFLSQNKGIFTLEFLSSISLKKVVLFSMDELFVIEEKCFGSKSEDHAGWSCYASDVSWFVRNEARLKQIPSKTLARWRHGINDIDDELLVHVEIKRRLTLGVDKDILKEGIPAEQLFFKLREYIRSGVSMNSVKHYLTLILFRNRRKKSLRQEVLEIIEILMFKCGVNSEGHELAVSISKWYINNPQIPQDDRDWFQRELNKLVSVMLKRYSRFSQLKEESFLSFDRFPR